MRPDSLRRNVGDVSFRIVGTARPIGAAAGGGKCERRVGTFGLAHHRRCEYRTQVILGNHLRRFRFQLRREIRTSSIEQPCRS